MSMFDADDAECCICKIKLDYEKQGVEWFVLGNVDYEAAYGLGQYSSRFCHYDCYNKWKYKEEYEKEVKLKKEHDEELERRLESANASERRQIMEEEVRQWNEKVKRNKYNFEVLPEQVRSDDEPEYDFSYLLDELEPTPEE